MMLESGSQFVYCDILDSGFSGGWAQNWASIVPCPTNSTQNSAIYKLTSGLADSTLHFYCFVSSKQRSQFRNIEIDTWNAGLAGWRLPLFTDANPYEVSNSI
jgi:hypothetical protein